MIIKCIICKRQFEQKYNKRTCGCKKYFRIKSKCQDELKDEYSFFAFRKKVISINHDPIHQFYRLYTDDNLTNAIKEELVQRYS